MNSVLLVFAGLVCFGNVDAEVDPLLYAKRVADRLIEDTSFDIKLVSQNSLPSPCVVDPTPYVLSEGEVTVNGTISAEFEGVVTFGFSSASAARVWINGRQVFKSKLPGSALAQEIGDGVYKFADKSEVLLRKGDNTLQIKSNGRLSLGAIDLYGRALGGVICSVNEYSDFIKRVSKPSANSEYVLSVKDGAAFSEYPYAEWNYANGTAIFGLISLGRAVAEPRYEAFAERYCDFSLDNMPLFRKQYFRNASLRTQNYRLFRMSTMADAGAPAVPLIEMRRQGKVLQAGELFDRIVKLLERDHGRLPDGTFVRSVPRGEVRAEDLFFSVPFLVRYAKFAQDESIFDWVSNLIKSYDSYLYDTVHGLYHHGWDSEQGLYRGTFWARANGYLAWATSEALLHLPQSHKDRMVLLDIHKRQLTNLAGHQSEDGLWCSVIDDPQTKFDTSSSAMFVLAMSRAVTHGWVDGSLRENALKGWSAIEECIDERGVVSGILTDMEVSDDPSAYNDGEYYFNEPVGVGAVLGAAVEVDRLIELHL